MELIYKNKKQKTIIFPLVFILLLAFNFKMWVGTHSVSNLKQTIVSQSKGLGYCILSNEDNGENVKVTVQIKQLLDVALLPIFIDCLLLYFTPFILTHRSKLFCGRRDTLVSLCVRIDD